MKISQNEDSIKRKRAEKLNALTISSKNKLRYNLQRKLVDFDEEQKEEREKIIRKAEKKLSAYLNSKRIDYDKKCKNEIRKFKDLPPKEYKPKQISHNKLLDKLLTLLQLFARLRDSDHCGFGICISCGAKVHYKDAHGGHFISRMFKSVCTRIENINLQCSTCNFITGPMGNKKEAERINLAYRDNLIKKYSSEMVQDLESTKESEIRNPAKYGKVTDAFIIEEMEYYTSIVAEMKKNKQPTQ